MDLICFTAKIIRSFYGYSWCLRTQGNMTLFNFTGFYLLQHRWPKEPYSFHGYFILCICWNSSNGNTGLWTNTNKYTKRHKYLLSFVYDKLVFFNPSFQFTLSIKTVKHTIMNIQCMYKYENYDRNNVFKWKWKKLPHDTKTF